MISGPRALLGRLTLAALVALGSTACKKGSPNSQNPDASQPAPVATDTPVEAERDPVEMIRWQVEVDNLADLLAKLEVVVAQLQGGDAPALKLRPMIESLIAQRGILPEFAKGLDWGGRWSIRTAYPQPGQEHARPEDFEFIGRMAAKDPKALVANLGDDWSVEAKDEGIDHLEHTTRKEFSFDLKSADGYALIGRRAGDLHEAATLGQKAPPARLTLRSENMHAGDVDPGALLPLPAALSAPIGQALRSASATEFLLDVDQGAGLRAHLHASADLSRYGFDFLGPARSGPSELASRLPEGAALLVSISWGDPKLIHEELDRLTKNVPEPFDAWIAETLAGAHDTLDVVRDEAIVGLYFDDKGRAALVIAGGIKDQKSANDAVRKVMSGAFGIAEKYKGVIGSDKDYRFSVSYQPEGLGFSKAKADLLEASVPKALLVDAKRLEMFFGAKKPELEMLAHMDERYGLVAIGAGARGVMSKWVRSLGSERRSSAESEGGLALARQADRGSKAAAGCQLCIAAEPTSLLRMWLTHRRDFKEDSTVQSALDEANQLGASGHLAFGLRASGQEAALGVAASGRLLFAQPSILASVMRLGDLLPETFDDAPRK